MFILVQQADCPIVHLFTAYFMMLKSFMFFHLIVTMNAIEILVYLFIYLFIIFFLQDRISHLT